MRALFLLFLAAFALAQAPKPLKVGELTGEALYPGNRGVSYGEVGLVARGLGLALWQGEGQVALGLGARYRTFPVEADEAKAASSLAAWRKDGRVYVPLRPLADALGLSYQAQVGIQLDLPWARLLQVEARPEGYLLRFSREVNAVVRPGGVLFLMAQGSHPSLVQEAMGLFLPLSRPPERVYYPGGGQVAVGLTPSPPLPHRPPGPGARRGGPGPGGPGAGGEGGRPGPRPPRGRPPAGRPAHPAGRRNPAPGGAPRPGPHRLRGGLPPHGPGP